MRRRRSRLLGTLLVLLMVAVPAFAGSAGAQQQQPEGQDTNGDGVLDDFDFDGFADDLDGDCIPDDFNGDGIPDGDNTEFVCPEGRGGTLPTQLSLQQVAIVLDYVYQRFPDVTEPNEEADGFPNIPREIDPATGEDLGPDFSSLDMLLGEPGERDLLQLPDDRVNQEMLEFEDINNEEFTDPFTGGPILVATPEALLYTLGQVARAGGNLGLVAGSGSTLKGPCMGQVWSYDSDGQPLDVAFDWNREQPPFKYAEDGSDELIQAFTSDDPFKVHVDGAIIYTGIAGGFANGTGPWEHDWFIDMNFLGFTGANLDAGGDPNSNYENRNAGAVNFNEDLPAPAKISGLVAANAQMKAPGTGNGAPNDQNSNEFFCIGSGFVEFEGGIPLSAPGAALVFLSTVGLLFNARPARTFGGV
ncbi:MAG: hypothetical protein ACR2QO_07600 [Acidimicrobiales bacterium]